ncbi:MAG: amino acid--tRNA ligase-related protein [Christensenellaceae bacterium]
MYTFGPTFRAENSNTPRHASEFWMIEPEIAFAELQENMDLAEAMVKYIIRYVLENYPEEMEFLISSSTRGCWIACRTFWIRNLRASPIRRRWTSSKSQDRSLNIPFPGGLTCKASMSAISPKRYLASRCS